MKVTIWRHVISYTIAFAHIQGLPRQAQTSPTNSILRTRLAELTELQKRLATQPYSVVLRLKLAKSYKYLGYPDLAVGDAYKALLLIDEVVEELEYHEMALDAAKADIASLRAHKTASRRPNYHNSEHAECCCISVVEDDQAEAVDDDEAVTWAKTCWSKTAYDYLAQPRSLQSCHLLGTFASPNA